MWTFRGSALDVGIVAINVIKYLLNYWEGKLENFHLENFQFLFFLTENTHLWWDGKLITAKVHFRLDDVGVRCVLLWEKFDGNDSLMRNRRTDFQRRWKNATRRWLGMRFEIFCNRLERNQNLLLILQNNKEINSQLTNILRSKLSPSKGRRSISFHSENSPQTESFIGRISAHRESVTSTSICIHLSDAGTLAAPKSVRVYRLSKIICSNGVITKCSFKRYMLEISL